MFSSNQSNAAAAAAVNYIEDVFSTYLYTGNGSSITITNGIDLSTYGGLVWQKSRQDVGFNHILFDTVTGVNKNLSSNLINAQTTVTGNSVLSNGFVTDTNAGYTNENNYIFASWTWRKQEKYFDIQTWTGSGANRTISHSLGSVPGCIMVKRTDTAGAWQVYHRSLANTDYLVLNTTAASATGATRWNSTTPTSTVFSLGTDATVNSSASGATYVAYLFAHDAGGFGLTGTDNVISCGSYTGNGSTSGPTVTLGYEPQWVMIKTATAATYNNWFMFDTMRGISYGSGDAYLYANLSNAETTGGEFLDLTATGFNLTKENVCNESGVTYIYIAIRRGPMKVPTTGTSVFSPIASSDTQGTQQTTGFPVDLQIAAYRPGNANNSTANDRLRGVSSTSTGNTNNPLVTSSTAAETAGGIGTQGWNNTGFGIPAFLSISSSIYWNFRRAPSFFDEVCYMGTGVARTVSHNLAAVPELMIAKCRGDTGQWAVYSSNLTASNFLFLNSTAASATNTAVWNATAPTNSVFSVGTSGNTNSSGFTFVAYLFATCAGVSKVGSYTGTGTTLQIDCGFTAGSRFVLIKRTDSTGDWYVWDSARGIVAGNDPYLLINSTAAEVTSTDYIDTYSAGFEISSTAPAAINSSASGATYIFLAIA